MDEHAGDHGRLHHAAHGGGRGTAREPDGGQAHDHDHDHDHHHGGHTIGVWQRMRAWWRPHRHDPADSIDDALAASAEGIRTVKLSLLGLGATALLQLAVALASGSVALLADTIHNFADALTSVPLWLAFSMGRWLPTRRYTYGYGRAEDLAGVFVVLMIAASAALAFLQSLGKLVHPEPIEHLGWVVAAALVGVLGNEQVARYRIRAGERIGSAALVADGYHARSDAFTSLAVLAGAAGVWLGFPLADPLLGMAISVMILFTLKEAASRVGHRLMDGIDPALLERAETAARGAQGVEAVTAVRARWIGHALHAEIAVVADGELSLAEAHRVAERVRHAVLHAIPMVGDATVHVDPSDHAGDDAHAELAHHDRRLAHSH